MAEGGEYMPHESLWQHRPEVIAQAQAVYSDWERRKAENPAALCPPDALAVLYSNNLLNTDEVPDNK